MASMMFKIFDRLYSIERTLATTALKRIELLEERISALDNRSQPPD